MAEHAAQAAEEQQLKKKRPLLKLLIVALNVVLFLAGIGALAWTKFGPKPQATAAVAQEQGQPEAQPAAAAQEPAAKAPAAPAKATGEHGAGAAKGHGSSASAKSHGGHGGDSGKGHGSGDHVLVPLAPFIVNLSGDQGQRYLRLVAQVEVRGELSKAEIEKRLPEVRNRLLFLLSSKTYAEIGSIQGKYDLQADITRNINETLDGPFVRKTYFTEFIVQ